MQNKKGSAAAAARRRHEKLDRCERRPGGAPLQAGQQAIEDRFRRETPPGSRDIAEGAARPLPGETVRDEEAPPERGTGSLLAQTVVRHHGKAR